jgi:hypothetical protein
MRLIWFKVKNQLMREKECVSRRFLCDVVCLSVSFSYETCIKRENVCIPNLLDLVYTYELLQKYVLDPKDLLLDDTLAFLHRNPVCDIVLNLIESSLMGKIQDQSVSTYVLDSLSVLTLATGI